MDTQQEREIRETDELNREERQERMERFVPQREARQTRLGQTQFLMARALRKSLSFSTLIAAALMACDDDEDNYMFAHLQSRFPLLFADLVKRELSEFDGHLPDDDSSTWEAITTCEALVGEIRRNLPVEKPITPADSQDH
jgi:hypothetical protein